MQVARWRAVATSGATSRAALVVSARYSGGGGRSSARGGGGRGGRGSSRGRGEGRGGGRGGGRGRSYGRDRDRDVDRYSGPRDYDRRGAGSYDTDRRRPLAAGAGVAAAAAGAGLAAQRASADASSSERERDDGREEEREYVHPFDAIHNRLQKQLAEGLLPRRDELDRLLSRMSNPWQAEQALQLLRSDATARDAVGWDWSTLGYGQLAFALVQDASAVGAPEVAEALLESREALHITLNKDLVPSLMRKVAAGAALEAEDSGGEISDDHVAVVQRLYVKEVELRGSNSPEAATELSKVLRRAEDVDGVSALHAQLVGEGLGVRPRLLEDLERWLAKRGVSVGA
ncbi:hypothetical protein HYH03_005527 [Edaphochlamys debaryana]|uniref:Uncharacterized protein n=1 Tax=Edaphochlamys debaryana TaxID=47281 RepID=A0A835YET3_9CHLO|nr:hypothetical protein HYH03_005527 [Edaphochlamys debaryana]|eukprot:KAG2496294.1 hypothetical protein HYH03_005527 [Edaphochlamys debaryana]